ncbi:hypothetical protein C8R45DRAFT_325269 [Mycena sanguinolenta]|nr:hypothetical protein C8R45DRAFT_325269 [Mycena sanguinolenta]
MWIPKHRRVLWVLVSFLLSDSSLSTTCRRVLVDGTKRKLGTKQHHRRPCFPPARHVRVRCERHGRMVGEWVGRLGPPSTAFNFLTSVLSGFGRRDSRHRGGFAAHYILAPLTNHNEILVLEPLVLPNFGGLMQCRPQVAEEEGGGVRPENS